MRDRSKSRCGSVGWCRPRRLRAAAAAIMVIQLALSGCATPKRISAPPQAMAARSVALPGPTRFLVARDTADLALEAVRQRDKEIAWRRSQGEAAALPPMYMLAISGGGDNGAFSAGLLNGWTAAGDRPHFNVVTGVSTGALIAPYAFLGVQYDPVLTQLYTGVSSKDIFRRRSILSGLFGDALSDTTPLARLLRTHVNAQLLAAIAAEYGKGRLLLVGTTNLDTGEPVVWNMTAIAASADPRAPELFRKILLASSAIPGVFPPVLIDVENGGAYYQEMHVDGGAMAQVFLYPPSLAIPVAAGGGLPTRTRRAYIIRNARLDAQWLSVERRTLPIATRAVEALMQSQGVGDIYRIFATTKRDQVEFNLAYIPATFTNERKTPFDTAYMRALYKVGYDMAAGGYPWVHTPPGYLAAPPP